MPTLEGNMGILFFETPPKTVEEKLCCVMWPPIIKRIGAGFMIRVTPKT
jgi:hypothetical protein